jgi:hypothetical protein
MLRSEINKSINSVWNNEQLPQQWKEPFIVLIYKKRIKLTEVIIEEYHCYQLHRKYTQFSM